MENEIKNPGFDNDDLNKDSNNTKNNETHQFDDSNGVEKSKGLDPSLGADLRRWNSNSGFPRGDRNRIIDNHENQIFDDDDDDEDIFDDEDEVL